MSTPREMRQQFPGRSLVPHIGYVTEDQYRVRYSDTVEDVAAYLRGEPIRILNPEVLYTD